MMKLKIQYKFYPMSKQRYRLDVIFQTGHEVRPAHLQFVYRVQVHLYLATSLEIKIKSKSFKKSEKH